MKLLHTLMKKTEESSTAITYGVGGVFIVGWTLLKFFTQSTTYDLVTQQLVARQWLHGNFSHISFGTTNYLLKLWFLYMPTELLPGSPHLKLILLTLLINLVSFVILFKLICKILEDFGIKPGWPEKLSALWLAAISGSVFWIQYANSRNLEVAGGMLLVYLGLKILKRPVSGQMLALWALASLLFFSDTLQVYMVGLPLVIYAAINARAYGWRAVRRLATLLALAYAAAQAIFWLVAKVFNIQFIGAGSFVRHLGPSQIVDSAPTATANLVRLFSGRLDGGWPRLVCVAALLIFILLFFWASLHKKLPRRLASLALIFFITDLLIYLVSGQGQASGTERYLIMLAPIAVMVLGPVCRTVSRPNMAASLIGLLIGLNLLSLGHALATSWSSRFGADDHLFSTAEYAKSHHLVRAYASMDTALPVEYYKLDPGTNFIALACNGDKLQAAISVQRTQNPNTSTVTFLFLDGNVINNVPSSCNEQSIVKQLGKPISQDSTRDGSTVFIYPRSTLNF